MSSPPSPPIVPSVPAVPGQRWVGNLAAFRKDRLALQDEAGALGPIARFQLLHIPVYIVTDADLAHQILVTEADAFEKSAGLQFLAPVLGEGLLSAEGEVHKRHRKLLAPAFAPKRLAAYGEIMVEETATQVARWAAGPRVVDLAAEMMQLTLAIAGRTLFGASIRGEAAQVAHGLELAMRSMVANLVSPIRLPYPWPLPRHVQMWRAVRMLDEVVFRLIEARRREGGDHGDVLSMLLMARDEGDGTGFSDRQIRDEVMTLLLAGHETTANALTWTWHELGRNPDVLARLRAELAEVVGDRAVTADDLPQLPIVAAALDEAMRLHPPAYTVGRQAMREVSIGGHRMPAGSTMVINIRGIHRRADYFPEPLAFRPERMFADAKKARPRHHYLPFGAGPRVCIGQHFALLEGQLALATLVQRADIRPLQREVAPEPLVTLRPLGGLPAVVGVRASRAP
jgi:cytochrome P450